MTHSVITESEFVAQTSEDNRQILDRYDPDDAIRCLDLAPTDDPYYRIPRRLERLWTSLEQEFGTEAFRFFQGATLLRLQKHFEARAADKRYTDGIRECFAGTFERIRGSIIDPTFEKYSTVTDPLLKDLAVSTQRLFPAGAQLVESNSGFHRALMIRGGLWQGLGVLRILLQCHGNKPLYQLHTHLIDTRDFNPPGWHRCYLRLAGMLELNPDIRGVWSSSWYFDPALSEISPHLVYLRDIPIRNGAALFFSHIDPDGGALYKSETRRRLCREGTYTPKSYSMIWPRTGLLQWAASHQVAKAA